jgi:hypothetical protein
VRRRDRGFQGVRDVSRAVVLTGRVLRRVLPATLPPGHQRVPELSRIVARLADRRRRLTAKQYV